MIKIVGRNGARQIMAQRTRSLSHAEDEVAPIIADVRARGDAAVLDYARKFDRFEGDSVRVEPGGELSIEMQGAVEVAAANIREYARTQFPAESFRTTPDGRRLG